MTELEKWFYKAQEQGHVPCDEPFDPAMIMTGSGGRKWPYWLSVSATTSINAFVASINSTTRKGWSGIVGEDADKNLHELSFLWFDEKIIWVKTGIRRQNFEFPSFDLLRELTMCELDLKLSKFRRGEIAATPASQFQQVCERFCTKYDAHPSHSHAWGATPFCYSWNHTSGWSFERPA